MGGCVVFRGKMVVGLESENRGRDVVSFGIYFGDWGDRLDVGWRIMREIEKLRRF